MLLLRQYLNIYYSLSSSFVWIANLSRWLIKKRVDIGSHCVCHCLYATIVISTAAAFALSVSMSLRKPIQCFQLFYSASSQLNQDPDKRKKNTAGVVSISCPAMQYIARHVAVKSIDVQHISCENCAYLAVCFQLRRDIDCEFSREVKLPLINSDNRTSVCCCDSRSYCMQQYDRLKTHYCS